MILLTGVTGTTGKEVANLMKDATLPVRAMVRNIEKATFLKGSNIELIEGSFDDADSINFALDGVNKAFLLPANSENQLEHEIRFIDLAKDNGVEHIVKFSVICSDSTSDNQIFQWHGKQKNILKNQELLTPTYSQISLCKTLYLLLVDQLKKKMHFTYL